MSFVIKIEADSGNARPTIQGVTGDLKQTEDAAADASTALGKLGTAGAQAGQQVAAGMKSAGDQVGATGETFSAFYDRIGSEQARVLQQIKGPWERYQADLRATSALFDDGRISQIEYEAASARLADRLEALQNRSLTPQLKLEADMYAAIVDPLKRYEEELQALDTLLKHEQITLEQYDAALAKVQKRGEASGAIAPKQGPAFNPELAGQAQGPVLGPTFDPNQAGRGLSEELKREQQILEQITGPFKRYEQELQALDALLKKDQISLEQYEASLAKVQKRAEAAGAIAPVQGPVQQATGPAAAAGGDPTGAAQNAIGTAASLFTGGAVGAAIIGLGEQIDGLIHRYHDLEDVAIDASNAAMKFADATHSTTLIINEQIALAHELHSNYTATVELYDTVRDGTDDLNISHADQIRLTKSLAEEVQLAGRSMESAGGIVTRFSYALARGKIEVGDLNRIMRQVPELGDLWTKTFDTDRQGLLAMVREGKIGVEDIVRSLVDEGKSIDANFERRQRTNKQKEEEWILNEKLYSQRYNVSYGAGHAAQEAVDTFKKNPEQMQAAMGASGPLSDLAQAANRQYLDEQKAALGELFKDIEKLEGPFQKLGDAYRKMTGDTAAVRAEITKLTEPVDAAKSEIDTLNKAFETGKIDVDTYNKKWAELQTTINHGIGPQAFKITEPIRIAKLELDAFNREVAQGADVTQAQIRKATTQYETAIHGGVTPEDLKLNNPVLDAKDAMADLIAKHKEGKVTAEAFRKEYDALITTMNDGRLPSTIKLWESFTLPIRDLKSDVAGLTALWESGRISLLKYQDEYAKFATSSTMKDLVQQQLDERLANSSGLAQRWKDQTRDAFGGLATVAPDAREQLDKYRANLERTTSHSPDSVSGQADVQGALEAGRETLLRTGDAWRAYNEQMERSTKLSNEFVEPAVKYEQTLKDIAFTLGLNDITQEQATFLQRKAREEYDNATEALQKQKGPLEAYEAALKKLNDQYERHDISAKKLADGIDAAKVAMIQATGQADTFKGAMQLDWIKMQQDADKFGATVANLAVSDFGKLNDAIVTVANGGAVSWSQMADSMIQDLERIFLKMEETKLIGWIASLGGSGGGADSTMDAGLVDEFAKGFGYATGGSFVVGGNGGTDTTPVAFRATRGERVTITPPGGYPYPQAPAQGTYAQAGSPPTIINQIHNHYDSSIAVGAIASPGGQTAVLNVLRANAPAIRSALGLRG